MHRHGIGKLKLIKTCKIIGYMAVIKRNNKALFLGVDLLNDTDIPIKHATSRLLPPLEDQIVIVADLHYAIPLAKAKLTRHILTLIGGGRI